MTGSRSVRGLRHGGAACAIALCVVLLGLPGVAGATLPRPKLPTPGTSKQVLALVAASHSIVALPTDSDPALADITRDKPNDYFTIRGATCPKLTSCVYGDVNSKKVIVLFGDSHAWMWLPAVYPAAARHGYKLILLFLTSCPAASVTYWDPQTNSYADSCTTARTAAIAAIRKLNPSLVLLSSNTAQRYSSPNVLFTSAQWEAGLDQTITSLASPTTQVGVIGDIPTLDVVMPECLAAYQSNVQQCGVAVPNPVVANRGLQSAEEAAAKQTGAFYIDTLPWLCSSTWCSPVIGKLIVYLNPTHIDATFSEYLSKVFGDALKPYLTAR
jgi:hypothetical protein